MNCMLVIIMQFLKFHSADFFLQILEMLEGTVATKAVDCTHFIAQKFVRTGNMLEAMAAGKFVVTFAWLESCKVANTFVDEMEFILEDERKEEDMCFSMRETLESTRRSPLLQGIRVMITANTNPKPRAIAAIVKAAGGLVKTSSLGFFLCMMKLMIQMLVNWSLQGSFQMLIFTDV